ncbi:hypothetical protein [Oceanobacillus sp. FSL H7-0719]|uniref:hypothetical protein n=1 Tax=Oceanobacillus sp. FSL H7-0719 TaxID=2954507 RepID=UPI003244A0C8
MIISDRELCNQKIASLKNGHNAFAESEKLIHRIEKAVAEENLEVFFERTPAGCWIIPIKAEVIH